jgi:hypothetical protein
MSAELPRPAQVGTTFPPGTPDPPPPPSEPREPGPGEPNEPPFPSPGPPPERPDEPETEPKRADGRVLRITLGVTMVLVGSLADVPILMNLAVVIVFVGGVLWILDALERRAPEPVAEPVAERAPERTRY